MVIEFFNDSKEEIEFCRRIFQKFKNSIFRFFSLFLFFFAGWNYRCEDIGRSFLLHRGKMRKIRRIHRKIEEGGSLSLYISRILLFLKRNNGKRDYVIHLWNKINLFFLYEYSPCVKRNILRVVLALRNNPEQGKHTSRRMYLHYFHYNGAELCAPRY